MATMQRTAKSVTPVPELPALFDLLSHRLRWAIVQQLTTGDVRVNEIVAHLGEPMNVVSYHLKKMRDQGLIVGRRSEADARDVYYSLELGRLKSLHAQATAALHPVLTHELVNLPAKARVLFVCSHNSARSQIAEAWLRHLSNGQVEAESAGINPGMIQPEAVRAMQAHGVDISGLNTKSVENFIRQPFDLVITVCDIAREEAPVFEQVKRYLHWGLPNPLKSPQQDQPEVYDRIASAIRGRVANLLTLLPYLIQDPSTAGSKNKMEDPTKPTF